MDQKISFSFDNLFVKEERKEKTHSNVFFIQSMKYNFLCVNISLTVLLINFEMRKQQSNDKANKSHVPQKTLAPE